MRNSLQWRRVSKVFFLLIQSKGAGLFCKAPRLRADSTHPENGFRFRLSRHNRGNLFDQRKTRDCLVGKKMRKMQTERWKIIVCGFTGQVETHKIFVALQMWARMDNIFIYATQRKAGTSEKEANNRQSARVFQKSSGGPQFMIYTFECAFSQSALFKMEDNISRRVLRANSNASLLLCYVRSMAHLHTCRSKSRIYLFVFVCGDAV